MAKKKKKTFFGETILRQLSNKKQFWIKKCPRTSGPFFFFFLFFFFACPRTLGLKSYGTVLSIFQNFWVEWYQPLCASSSPQFTLVTTCLFFFFFFSCFFWPVQELWGWKVTARYSLFFKISGLSDTSLYVLAEAPSSLWLHSAFILDINCPGCDYLLYEDMR